MDLKTSVTYEISENMVDNTGNCRPDWLMKLLQDTAEVSAQRLLVDRETLVEKYNVAWMLVRAWLELKLPIRAGQKLTVTTWPCKMEAMTTERCFTLAVDGEPVGQALQVWVLVDLDARRMVRMGDFEEMRRMPLEDKPMQLRLRRLQVPPLTDAGQYTIRPEDIDINDHMNNAHYLRCAMLPLEGKTVHGVQINYDRECRLGQNLQLQTARTDAADFVVGLLEDGNVCFEAKIW